MFQWIAVLAYSSFGGRFDRNQILTKELRQNIHRSESSMSAEKYHSKAASFAAKAREEKDPDTRLEYEMLAQSYLRLATHAERYPETDVVFGTPGSEPPQMVQQQQQQQQRKAEDKKTSPLCAAAAKASTWLRNG
jgi:hypothetical protein